jgi:hypothetical protein
MGHTVGNRCLPVKHEIPHSSSFGVQRQSDPGTVHCTSGGFFLSQDWVGLWFLGDIKIPHPDFCWLSLVLYLAKLFFHLLKTLSKRLIQKGQVMPTNILAFRSQKVSYDINTSPLRARAVPRSVSCGDAATAVSDGLRSR